MSIFDVKYCAEAIMIPSTCSTSVYCTSTLLISAEHAFTVSDAPPPSRIHECTHNTHTHAIAHARTHTCYCTHTRTHTRRASFNNNARINQQCT